jgi:hypothetical protein
MYSTCLFCTQPLGGNETIEHFPVGRRLAFDSAKGRLWVVCPSCGRWNLTPIEERWEAIDECERAFRDTSVRVSTTNIGLARLPARMELVRIGEPLLPEFAAWRYGYRFNARRRQFHLMAGAGVAAAAVAAVTLGPTVAPVLALGAISIIVIPGLTTVMGAVPVIGALAARDYLVHDRVVARIVDGRRLLTVRARHLGDTELHVDAATGDASLDMPHDGGWAHIVGTAAIQAGSRLLASANRFGATEVQVQDAVQRIEGAGDAAGFLARAATIGGWRGGKVMSLLNTYRGVGALRLRPTERLALEMAMHEETERRALEGELEVLANAWRDAERIAEICDTELS